MAEIKLDFLQTHAKWLVPTIHVAVGLFIYENDQKIMSWDVPEFIIFAALGASLWIFWQLYKDVTSKQSSETADKKKIEELELELKKRASRPAYAPPIKEDYQQGEPFDLNFNNGR